jgi:uncharacterized glyoxalase superfamily protein PhnB
MTNLCSGDLEKSKLFYSGLFDFEVGYDSDWFVQLVSADSDMELGLIAAGHELVPEQVQHSVSGMYLTFVVDNVDAFFESLASTQYEVWQVPIATPYGQKCMLLRSPEGTICDVSSPLT